MSFQTLKKKSFTLIEIIVIIMIISFFSIGVMQGLSFFQNESIHQEQMKKLKVIEKDFQKIFTFRNTSFLFKDYVPYYLTDTSETIKLYENNGSINPIFDTSGTIPKVTFTNFWKTSIKNLTDFANKPFDIIVENRYFDYYTVVPYKNVFVISWGRINSYPSFTNFGSGSVNLKELFFKKDPLTGAVTFYPYASLSPADKTTVNDWLDSKGLTIGFINKEINHIKINNMQIMKEKIKVTMDKIDKIEKNLKYWVTAQIKSVSGTGSMPGKDFFLFTKYNGDSLIQENSGLDYNTSFMDTIVDDDSDTAYPKYTDETLANVFSFIDKAIDNGENERYITTRPFETFCEDLNMGMGENSEDSSGTSVDKRLRVVGMAPLDESYTKCVPGSEINVSGVDLPQYSLLHTTKRIMGLISNIDGKEEVSSFPIFIGNSGQSVSGSTLASGFEFFSNEGDAVFAMPINNSAPIDNGTNYTLPPYNLTLLAVFPWVMDGNIISNAAALSSLTEEEKITNIYFNSFGFYLRKIYSVSTGI